MNKMIKMKFLVIVFCAVTTLVNSQKVEGLCSSVDLLGIGVKNNEIKL